jgi:hypothetical protein
MYILYYEDFSCQNNDTLIKLEMNGATTIGHKFKKGKEGYMF